MATVTVPKNREDTREIVKVAFEDLPPINTYYDYGNTITGVTSADLGLFTSSYGEQVHIEIPVDQPNDDETLVHVHAERKVELNITANTEKRVDQFIHKLESLKDKDIDVIEEVVKEEIGPRNTKEVSHPSQQKGGIEFKHIVIGVFIFFILMLVILP